MTRSAPEPSRRAQRHEARKRRRRTLRQLERARRSATTMLVLATVGLTLVLACSFGLQAFWCVPQPFQLILSVATSAIAGLALGALIRVRRERGVLDREEHAHS